MCQGPAAAVESCSKAGSSSLGGSQHRVWHQRQGRSLFKWWVGTALCAPLGGHLAFTAQEDEALSMLHMACSLHLFQRALSRMPRRCTQRDLKTVRQRIMPYFPQATIVRSGTGCHSPAAHVPLQPIVHNAISMARVIGKPPLVALPLLSFHLMRLPWMAGVNRLF